MGLVVPVVVVVFIGSIRLLNVSYAATPNCAQTIKSRTHARGKTHINPKVTHGREGHIHRRENNGACARACHKMLISSRFVGANVGAKSTIPSYLIVTK